MTKQTPTDQGRLSDTLQGSAAVARDEGEIEMKAVGLSRMVDMRIPLWGILSSVGALVMLLINMWMSVQQLTVAMVDVQATLKAGNAQAGANAIEIATIKLRLETTERGLRDMQQQLNSQQYSRKSAA